MVEKTPSMTRNLWTRYCGSLASWPPPELYYDKIRRVAESEYVALTKW